MAYIWLRVQERDRSEEEDQYLNDQDRDELERQRADTSVYKIYSQVPETFGFVTLAEFEQILAVLARPNFMRYGLYLGSFSDGEVVVIEREEEDPRVVSELREFLGDRHVVLLDLIAIALQAYREEASEE